MGKYVSLKLATKATLSVLDKFEKKKSSKWVERTGKGLNLFISNKDIDYIFKIVESLKTSGLLLMVQLKQKNMK